MEAKLTGAVVAGFEAIAPYTTVAADDLFSVSGAGRRRVSAALVAEHKNAIVTDAAVAAFVSPSADRTREAWAAAEKIALVGGSHSALPAKPSVLRWLQWCCKAHDGPVKVVVVISGLGSDVPCPPH